MNGYVQTSNVEQVVESSEGCTIQTLQLRGTPRAVLSDLENASRWLVVEVPFFGARAWVYLTQGRNYHTGKAEFSGAVRAYFLTQNGNGQGIWIDQYYSDFSEIIRRLDSILGDEEISPEQHQALALEVEDRMWREWFSVYQISLAATLRKLV